MSTWDEHIFTEDVNVEFLEDLNNLEEDDIIEAVRDAVVLATDDSSASEDEELNALAAATIAAIWAGAPFTAGEVVSNYPYIRDLVGYSSEALNEKATELLEGVEEEYDLEAFLEALA
ncbi:DUF4259 domain-containing protein [Corynebacterium sp. L4756]|uniref:DUF4259 domain-containing protein n=1 Tax=unclassified Corynebacterium TaxID=2624378 RepID=UPI00374C9B21